MERWTDTAIILSHRAHSEHGLILSVFSEHHGLVAAYLPGGQSQRAQASIQSGNYVMLDWQARLADQMGRFDITEIIACPAQGVLHDPMRLLALQSALALVAATMPEREIHTGLYHGMLALFDALPSDHWGPSYVVWEMALLRELGFALDLSRCAVTGRTDALSHVSPKTGRAVCAEAAAPYRDKLLAIPDFLKPQVLATSNRLGTYDDVLTGLLLTGYFLEHWVMAQHVNTERKTHPLQMRLTLMESIGRQTMPE